jgi:hypothetical protein
LAGLPDGVGKGNSGSKHRVLVLTTTLPARPGDGTPEFVLSLARELADRFDLIILAPASEEHPRENSSTASESLASLIS